MREKEELGKVEKVFLGKEDHGIMTMYIDFSFGHSHQSFGGRCLEEYDKKKRRRVGSAAGMDFIIRILDTFNVQSIDELVGKYAYVIRDEEVNPRIVGFRTAKVDGDKTFLVKDWQDDWFALSEEVK